MVTVSEGIKQVYASKFNWEVDVILNSPRYQKIVFRKTDSTKIKMVHHGGASPSRNLEKLINVIPFLSEEFELHFYLTPTYPNYLINLKELASKISPRRIFFHEPVLPENVIKEISQYDIGIHNLSIENINHQNALPNKFFDFMMAGLGVMINPLPAMKELLEELGLGITLDGEKPQEWATQINSLSVVDIDQFKKNSMRAAKTLNAEVEMKKLHSIYESLLKNGK
jgi:hypothetical protein